MGIPILILGDSGSGKSTSLRNFTPEEVAIFNVASKPLPFRNLLPKADGADYQTIIKGLAKCSRKAYVIDDSQYLMAFEGFERAQEKGYEKFTQLALNFYNLIIPQLFSLLILIFLLQIFSINIIFIIFIFYNLI